MQKKASLLIGVTLIVLGILALVGNLLIRAVGARHSCSVSAPGRSSWWAPGCCSACRPSSSRANAA